MRCLTAVLIVACMSFMARMAVADTRSYEVITSAGQPSQSITYPVVESLVVVGFDTSWTNDSVAAFMTSFLFLDTAVAPMPCARGFWRMSIGPACSYAQVRDSLLTNPEVLLVNPVLRYSRKGLALPNDRIVILIKEEVSTAEMLEALTVLPIEITSVDSVSPTLWDLRVTGSESGDVIQIAAAIHASGLVVFAQPDFSVTNAVCWTPNDPYFSDQWYFLDSVGLTNDNDLDADLAWEITKGSAGIAIAWVDGGIDKYHEDLSGLTFYHEFDPAGNDFGRLDDPDSDPQIRPDCTDDRSTCFHGTATAGMVYARANNGTGVAGLAPGCRIIPRSFAHDEADAASNAATITPGFLHRCLPTLISVSYIVINDNGAIYSPTKRHLAHRHAYFMGRDEWYE